MDGKKNLSSARQKLQQYKISKGVGAGTTFTEVNETGPRPSIVESHGAEIPYFVPPPPPVESIQTFVNNLSQDLISTGKNETKVLNINTNNYNLSLDFTETPPLVNMSTFSEVGVEIHNCPTPTAPSFEQAFEDQSNQKIPERTQNFPVSFFQSTPIAHADDTTQKSPYEQQDFYYRPTTETSTQPLFYNVSGTSITPMPPYNEDLVENLYGNKLSNFANTKNIQFSGGEKAALEPKLPVLNGSRENFKSQETSQQNISLDHLENLQSRPEDHSHEIPANISNKVQDQQAFNENKSFQDALELQLDELRRDNERLLIRQSELVSQLENEEKNLQELRLERDRCKEDSKKLIQPLNIKINNLIEENQRILKNSNNVGMELRSKLQEKTKHFEEMEQACIKLSNDKMSLAEKLDQEKEKSKELEIVVQSKDAELTALRNTVTKLEEKLKLEQRKDAVIHQLEDQIRHYQVQTGTFERELRRANNKIERLSFTNSAEYLRQIPEATEGVTVTDHHHEHGENCQHEHDALFQDAPNEHQAGHQEHDHSDGHDHTHDENGQVHQHPPRNEELEMKKRLHHLEWENSQFKIDLDKLASEAREKRIIEEKFIKISEDCEKYRCECQRFELLVAQLQGENDTIGDYIALYQSQKLALRESHREKDLQLTKEREALIRKIEELTQLLKVLKKSGEGITNNATNHQCTHSHPTNLAKDDDEIEGKIRNLIETISSSSLIENFHPCAVCSGRLMNV